MGNSQTSEKLWKLAKVVRILKVYGHEGAQLQYTDGSRFYNRNCFFPYSALQCAKWNCHVCTFGNSVDNVQCAMCSGAKIGYWKCSNCPVINSDDTTQCGTCLAAKP